jgi:hypothetical protein
MKPDPRRNGAARITLGALAMLIGLLCAQPALAQIDQFNGNDGLTDAGSPKWQFELTPYLVLPHTNAKIGLGRAPGLDPSVNLPRPTLADVIGKLDFAFDCACLVRYGDWSGEVNLLYVAVSASKPVMPLPRGPTAVVKSKVSLFLISPGVGYRVVRATAANPFSMDVRAGFTYDDFNANANFQGSRLALSGSHSSDFVQPWVGERMNYIISPKWRIDHTFALTGLGVDGVVGYNGNVGLSYLVSSGFDLSAGYAVDQINRNNTGRTGLNNSVSLFEYGPYVAAGFRF